METQNMQTPNLANDDIRKKIRTLYLDDKNMKEIREILGINVNTWDSAYYDNRHGFRDFMDIVKKTKFLMETERVSRKILSMDTTNNAKMLTIQQKEAEFVRETLLKDHGYTKRSEVIGLNINKNEPLDDEQKEKLNKILGK